MSLIKCSLCNKDFMYSGAHHCPASNKIVILDPEYHNKSENKQSNSKDYHNKR